MITLKSMMTGDWTILMASLATAEINIGAIAMGQAHKCAQVCRRLIRLHMKADDLGFDPNAALTLSLKRGSKPFIEGGDYYNHITITNIGANTGDKRLRSFLISPDPEFNYVSGVRPGRKDNAPAMFLRRDTVSLTEIAMRLEYGYTSIASDGRAVNIPPRPLWNYVATAMPAVIRKVNKLSQPKISLDLRRVFRNEFRRDPAIYQTNKTDDQLTAVEAGAL